MPDEILSTPETDEATPASAPEIGEESNPEQSNETASDASEKALDDIWSKHQNDGEAAESSSAPEDEQASAAKAEEGGSDKASEQQGSAEQPLKAPNTWTKEEQAAFDAAPPEAQKAIHRRMEQVEALARESLDAKNFARVMEPIGQVLADPETQSFLKTLQMPDGSRVAGNPRAIANEVRELFNIKRTLIENPAEGMRQISQWMRQWGLDPGNAAQAVEDGQQVDPRVAAMERELAQIKAKTNRQEHDAREYAFAEQQRQAVQRIARDIDSLSASKDASGSPSFPHLHGEHQEQVGEEMGAYIRRNMGPEGITPSLFKSAYEAAVFAHPATREAEFKAREASRLAEFRKNSDRARKAQGTRPAPGGPASQFEKMTPDEAMDLVWSRHNS